MVRDILNLDVYDKLKNNEEFIEYFNKLPDYDDDDYFSDLSNK